MARFKLSVTADWMQESIMEILGKGDFANILTYLESPHQISYKIAKSWLMGEYVFGEDEENGGICLKNNGKGWQSSMTKVIATGIYWALSPGSEFEGVEDYEGVHFSELDWRNGEYEKSLIQGWFRRVFNYSRWCDFIRGKERISGLKFLLDNLGIAPLELYDVIKYDLVRLMYSDDGYSRTGIILKKNGIVIPCEYRDHINYESDLISQRIIGSKEELICFSYGFMYSDIEIINKDALVALVDLVCCGRIYRWYGWGIIIKKLQSELAKEYGNKGAGLFILESLSQANNWFEVPAWSRDVTKYNFIRSSPLQSAGGVLQSVFVEDRSKREFAANAILSDAKAKGIESLVISQQYVDGLKGVANITQNSCEVSMLRKDGKIPLGAKGEGGQLSEWHTKMLHRTFSALLEGARSADKYLSRVQVEFVLADNGEIYLVQFRVLRPIAHDLHPSPPQKAIKGETYVMGMGKVSCKLSEVLIIDGNTDAEDTTILNNYKALVVRNYNQWLHILAYADSLKIPTVINTGDFEIPTSPNVEVIVDAEYKDGYVIFQQQ